MSEKVCEAQEAVRQVAEAPSDMEVRTVRRIEMGHGIQQGDVYAIRVPDTWAHGAERGTRQVALGSTVGSRHIAEGEGVKVYEGKELPEGVTPPDGIPTSVLLGPVVKAEGPWLLSHPEHAHHALPPGCYQITYQLDYTTQRRVQD